MKSAIVKVAAAAAVVMLVGCTDLKPLQAQVDDLKAQVGRLSSDVAAAKSSADAASSAAQSASSTASGAQSTANQALAAAAGQPVVCDATNEKIDRMFAFDLEVILLARFQNAAPCAAFLCAGTRPAP